MIASKDTVKRDYAQEEEQQARLMLSSVLFALAALALLFFTIPAYTAMRASQVRLVALAVSEVEDLEVSRAYEEAYVELSRFEPVLARAHTALPTLEEGRRSDVPELLATIEALVERDVGGIFLDELRVGSDSELLSREGEKVLAWRPITLSGLSGTGSVVRLLDQLRGTLHLIEPVRLSLEPAGEGVVRFTLELERAVIPKES